MKQFREIQEAFEQLLGESEGRPKSQPTRGAAEAEAAELLALTRQLGLLRQVEAPARLRERGLRRALQSRPIQLPTGPAREPSRLDPWSRIGMLIEWRHSLATRELQDVFERLLGESEEGGRLRPASSKAESEAVTLLTLARRLNALSRVGAPARLRAATLASALSGPGSSRASVVPLRRRPTWLEVGARVAAAAAAAVVVGYGTLAVSAASLPASPLYPVKLLVEDVQLAVAPEGEKPHIYTNQALKRLEETEALLQVGRITDAERVAGEAARRIESARAAAQHPSAPARAREAIGTTVEAYREVAENLTQRGGSPPPVAAARATGPTAPEITSLVVVAQASPTPTSGPNPAAPAPTVPVTGAQPVGAPVPSGGFLSVESSTVSNTGTAPSAPVSAPPSDFTSVEAASPAPTATGIAVGAPPPTFVAVELPTGAPASPTPTATRTPTTAPQSGTPTPTDGPTAAPTARAATN